MWKIREERLRRRTQGVSTVKPMALNFTTFSSSHLPVFEAQGARGNDVQFQRHRRLMHELYPLSNHPNTETVKCQEVVSRQRSVIRHEEHLSKHRFLRDLVVLFLLFFFPSLFPFLSTTVELDDAEEGRGTPPQRHKAACSEAVSATSSSFWAQREPAPRETAQPRRLGCRHHPRTAARGGEPRQPTVTASTHSGLGSFKTPSRVPGRSRSCRRSALFVSWTSSLDPSTTGPAGCALWWRAAARSIRTVSCSQRRKARSWRSLRRLADIAPVRLAIIMAIRQNDTGAHETCVLPNTLQLSGFEPSCSDGGSDSVHHDEYLSTSHRMRASGKGDRAHGSTTPGVPVTEPSTTHSWRSARAQKILSRTALTANAEQPDEGLKRIMSRFPRAKTPQERQLKHRLCTLLHSATAESRTRNDFRV